MWQAYHRELKKCNARQNGFLPVRTAQQCVTAGLSLLASAARLCFNRRT
ncbi:hypothetical protein Z950_1864 [Sulfitobacter mediterraneus KCTC 32188]|nr:hypothetical protein Z950_1864 [Sulfitobacter mediterraneus KCTC 32188]